jgi:hypothetical protein
MIRHLGIVVMIVVSLTDWFAFVKFYVVLGLPND